MVNTESITRLRPAILVVLRTTIDGAVYYRRNDLEQEREEADGSLVARWETTRVTRNPEEYAEAVRVRAAVRNGIAAACSVTSAFGLMCPVSDSQKLDAAVQEAREKVVAFNRGAKTCRVTLACLRGEIKATDAEAARAISDEIVRMTKEMENGIRLADPAAIRKAAEEARAIGAVLSDASRERVTKAIAEARAAASEIARRVGKAGEAAAAVVASIKTENLLAARRTFLDLSAPETVVAPLPPVVGGVELPAAAPEVKSRRGPKVPVVEV